MTVENGLPIPRAGRYDYEKRSVDKIPSRDSCECVVCWLHLRDNLNLIDKPMPTPGAHKGLRE